MSSCCCLPPFSSFSEALAALRAAPARRPGPQSFHARYLLSSRLGSGAFGAVYAVDTADNETQARVEDRAERELAVKVVDLGKGDNVGRRKARHWMQEVKLMVKVAGHRNVVQLHEGFKEDSLAYIVMDRGSFSLLQWLERLPRLTARSLREVFQQMLAGLATVHAAGVVHRDVKPENFLVLKGGTVQLIDFGLAKEGEGHRGAAGTAPFMAPEMLGGAFYGFEVDLWSLGVIAYVLFYGTFPYTARTARAMKDAIRVGRGTPAPECTQTSAVPPEAAAFVQSLLKRCPFERATAEAASLSDYVNAPRSSDGGVQGDREAEAGSEGESDTLWPMLASAKRIGAFGAMRHKPTFLEIDSRLRELQLKHHGKEALTARGSQASDTGSTVAGDSEGSVVGLAVTTEEV